MSAAAFAAALRAPTFACPPGLTAWNGSDPGGRFAIYRNNHLVSLVDALADSYPVVRALVGDEFFRAMAREFVLRSPPTSPVLAWYGADFPGFVAGFPPAGTLPCLADVARLEWLRVDAWHAADANPLPVGELAALSDHPARLPAARFSLHPALRVMQSPHPVVSIWDAHQGRDPGAALADIDMGCAEAAVLVRPGLEVEIVPVPPAAAAFIAGLGAGLALGAAAAAAPCDIAQALAVLIRGGALTAIAFPEETPS